MSSSGFDPSNVVLPSEEGACAIESGLMFGRGTIRIVYIGTYVIAIGLAFWSLLNRSALLTPVGPDFRALMIGLGVFLGILVAAVEREAWLLGYGGWRAPKGVFVGVSMLALVVASGFGGDFVARKLWEWRAFHGLHPDGVDRSFTVVGHSAGRSGDGLDLQDPTTGRTISISCSDAMYGAVAMGERLTLAVETGRGGAQRVTLPPLQDLRRD